MLGIIVPVIEEEFISSQQNLKELQKRLRLSSIASYKILVILQSKKKDIGTPVIDDVEYIVTQYYSVSNARNMGLDYFKYKSEYIYFLDQDALPSIEFLNITKKNMEYGYNVWSGKINWILSNVEPKIQVAQSVKSSIFFIPYNTFLGCYIFNNNLIKKHKILFNKNLGPAEDTYLKAGEDVLFICEFFSKNNINKCLLYPKLYIEHPARETNNCKTLLYLEGQAALYKYLVSTDDISFLIRFSSFMYLILYLGNGIYKFLKREENSYDILKKRFQAVFKKYDINKK